MMELANKKNVKVISLIIAAIFMFSFFIIGLDQSSFSQVSGSDPLNSAIGTVNYDELMRNAPGILEAQNTMKQAVDDSKKDFDEKSKNLSDDEKSKMLQEHQEALQAKEKELLEPLKKKVDDTIASVGKNKGLSVVVDKNTAVYGGLDITNDVVTALKKQK
jgi:outer membrane protein